MSTSNSDRLNAWNIYSAIISYLIAAVCITLMLIIYAYWFYNANKKVTVIRWTQYLSTFTLFSIILSLIWSALNYCGLWVQWRLSCSFGNMILWTILFFYRYGLSAIYIVRLQIVYQGTSFEYKYWVRILYASLILNTFLWFAEQAYIYTLDDISLFVHTQFGSKDIDIEICVANIPILAVIHYVVWELVFPIITMILFIHPVCKMMKMETDDDLYNRAVKYCIITCTAIISTFIFTITYAFFNILITGAIDTVINAACILLYEKWAHQYYQYICCPLHRLVLRRPVMTSTELKIVIE